MAELFRHTDEDGDSLRVAEAEEVSGRQLTAMVETEAGDGTVVYLDRHAALSLAAALVRYYGLKDITKESREGHDG